MTQNGSVPQVEVAPLDGRTPRAIGLVPSHLTGLPEDLWAGSPLARLEGLITGLADPQLPAAQALMYTLLLAETHAPLEGAAAAEALALARAQRLVKAGALDPALSLLEQIGMGSGPAHFDLWMQVSLLTGTEDRACEQLRLTPHLNTDYAKAIFCAARAQQWENAALTFGSAQALGLLPPEKLDLLDRFLHPDAFEEALPLPPPRKMDPLSFRLFEAIGEPQPTGALPRAYAVSDLRGLTGWKSQLEAAERLTRAGALPDNHLLGLYSERKPAASGGIWDRVAALQRFETALNTGSAEAVAKTLPPVWRSMTEARLEVSFANLFHEALAGFELTGAAGAIAAKVLLLSPAYESAAYAPDDLAAQIARGALPRQRPDAPLAAAVYDAFNDAPPRQDLITKARQKRLGESLLVVLGLLEEGRAGDAMALRSALASLRALGLEDTARRAALQLLLLER